jgi:hypothetical protein
MKKIKPRFVFDEDGNKTGVLLKKVDFDKMLELLEDYQDYLLIKKRMKQGYKKTYTAEQVRAEIRAKK